MHGIGLRIERSLSQIQLSMGCVIEQTILFASHNIRKWYIFLDMSENVDCDVKPQIYSSRVRVRVRG